MAKRQGLTTLCYLERNDEYLMLHRVRKEKDINAGKWIGVGGHLEDNESPEECIKREILEETGYDIPLSQLSFRGIVTFVSEKGEFELMSLFTANAPENEPKECDEGILQWIPKDEVMALNLWEGDRIFLKRLHESREFFSLKLVYDVDDKLKEAILNGIQIHRHE